MDSSIPGDRAGWAEDLGFSGVKISIAPRQDAPAVRNGFYLAAETLEGDVVDLVDLFVEAGGGRAEFD